MRPIGILAAVAMGLAVAFGAAAGAAEFALAPANSIDARSVEGLALDWFQRMRKGEIDRSQLTPEYSAQLTDDAVRGMSKFLGKYEYGAQPIGAQLLLQRSSGKQTFYIVKIVFPRGDAASLMFGFDADGKITGVSLLSMAGD